MYMKIKKLVIDILLVCCILVAAGSGWLLVREAARAGKNCGILESAAVVVNDVVKEKMEAEDWEDEGNLRLLGYEVLWRQNHDLAGWIAIEGTRIDYPVMQTEAGEDFYLDHNWKGESSAYGVPFADGNCKLGGGCRNVVVYGHHMKDGSMFADLVRYEDESFYEAHPVIRFDTLEACGEYQIIGVLRVPAVEEEKSFYLDMQAENEEQYERYVDTVKDRSLYDCGVEMEEKTPLLTLVTCEYSRKEGRMIVVAKKIS